MTRKRLKSTIITDNHFIVLIGVFRYEFNIFHFTDTNSEKNIKEHFSVYEKCYLN